MRPAPRRARLHDPTVYPVEEKVGEDTLQRLIVELLRPLVERWLAQRGVQALVGADQFIYWKQFDPLQRVAPDVYVLPGVSPDTYVSAWKTWESGIVPSFCFEVVSGDWRKDYAEAPPRYDAIGIAELVVFDPRFAERSDGLRWQVYRRLARRGFVRVEATNADRVRSKVLGCWLRAVGDEREVRVRLAAGARGDELVPTAEEAERLGRKAERVAKEAERVAKEAERAAKEAALARVRELEAALARTPPTPRRR
jgi:hypothetical protein